jgi:hypothetical protein
MGFCRVCDGSASFLFSLKVFLSRSKKAPPLPIPGEKTNFFEQGRKEPSAFLQRNAPAKREADGQEEIWKVFVRVRIIFSVFTKTEAPIGNGRDRAAARG